MKNYEKKLLIQKYEHKINKLLLKMSRDIGVSTISINQLYDLQYFGWIIPQIKINLNIWK